MRNLTLLFSNTFLLKVLETVSEIDKRLRFVTTFKGNRRDNNKNIVVNHTEMQIISIIASCFIQKYVTIEKDNRTDTIISRIIDLSAISTTWKSNKNSFKQNCVITYIMDCLNKKWRGSGDKKLNDIISNNSYYCRNVSWEEFEKVLDLWFDSILEERNEEKRPASPDESDKILLNVIYSQTFKAIEHLSDERFDIEHLATKGILRHYLEIINGSNPDSERLKLPISSFGNICYLPEADNRAKGKKTLYQDSTYLSNRSLKEIEANYSFTTHEDMKWLEETSYDKVTLRKKYLEFVRTRWSKQKEKIKECLY